MRERCRIGLHVLIRPRPGDFVYGPGEIEAMRASIAVVKAIGADGVALGCLTADGRVDLDACRLLIEAARPLSVTFHRAIDRVVAAAEANLRRLGVDRVLTSGGAVTAEAGLDGLRRWAATGIGVIAAGGVRARNVGRIVAATGVSEVHAALDRLTSDRSPPGLTRAVRDLVEAANGISPPVPAGRS